MIRIFLLQKLGIISQNITWLQSLGQHFSVHPLFDAWMGVQTVALMFLSGLSNIPKSSYEAAMVDGCISNFNYSCIYNFCINTEAFG